MRRLHLTSALLALTITLTACTDPVPAPTTADLTLQLQNVASARVRVTTAAGEVKFDDTVTGSKTLSALPSGKYTVTGNNTATAAAPGAQTADLSAGDATTTLDYAPLRGSLTLKVEGVPGARMVVKDAAGKEVFADTVTSSKVLADLPYGEYTVTPEKVEGQITPAAQTVTVGGNVSATLSYSTTPLPNAALTLTVNGVPGAQVTVKQGDTVLFGGPVTGTKVLGDLPRSSVTVSGGNVSGYTTPGTQTVDLGSGSGSASLNYAAVVVVEPKPPGAALDPSRLQGSVTGWTGGSGFVVGLGPITAPGLLDLTLPTPQPLNLRPANQLLGCALSSTNPDAQTSSTASYSVKSPTGALLGTILETRTPTSPPDGSSRYLRIYSTAATTLSGSGPCGPNNETVIVTLTLQPGWNFALLEQTGSGAQLINVSAGRAAQPHYLMFQAEPTKLEAELFSGSAASVQLPKRTVGFELLMVPKGQAEGNYTLSFENAPAGITFSEPTLRVAGTTYKELTFTLPEGTKPGKIDATLVLTGPAGTVRLPLSITVQAPLATPVLTLEGSSLSVTPGGNVTFKGNVRSSGGTISSLYLSLNGDATDLSLSPSPLSNVTEAGQDVTFTLSAYSRAVAGERNLEIVLNSYNGAEQVKVPVKVNVLSSGFTLRLDSSDLSIYPGESVNVPVTLSSVNGYSGPVNLSVSGLPQGVTAQPKTVNLIGSSVSTNLVLTATADAAIDRSTFSIRASDAVSSSGQVAELLVYPPTIKLSAFSSSSLSIGPKSVDAQNNLWISANAGFAKVSPTLTVQTYPKNNTDGCGPLNFSEDGNLWDDSGLPFVKVDPASGVATKDSTPLGSFGCGRNIVFDAKSRGWYSSGELYRVDTVNHVVDKVPNSSYFYGERNIEGNTLWSVSGTTVRAINTDTLAVTSFTVPGASINSSFFPRGGLLHFVDSGKLATFDPVLGTVSRANSGTWQLGTLYGLDSGGNAWASATRYDSGYRQALLRLSPSGTVLKELPAFSGSFAVSPAGGLWFTTNTYNDSRISYIAP